MTEYLIAHLGHIESTTNTFAGGDRIEGYHLHFDKAGRYSEEEARSICRTGLMHRRSCGDCQTCAQHAIPEDRRKPCRLFTMATAQARAE